MISGGLENMDKKKRVSSFLQLGIITLLLTGLDQWTKMLAVRHLKDQMDVTLIPNVLYLRYLENRGAAFGIFQDQRTFLLILSSLILVGVCYTLWKLPAQRKYRYLKILCFTITAGGAGNLIDRIRLNYVVDFIYFSPIDFPIFNVADIYVTLSIILLFVLVMFYYKEEDFVFLKWNSRKQQEKKS